jgi:N-acetylmuramoyl-L-alanine amidase
MPRPLFRILPSTLLLVACAAPPQPAAPVRGLDPPVPSPPAELDAAGRLSWWQDQLPRLGPADYAEARLLMGELHLELRASAEARQAFYESLGASLSASEMARAERGIGLSYLMEDRAPLAIPHLRKAVPDLDARARGETEYLLAAVEGRAVSSEILAYAAQAEPWLPAGMAGLVQGAALRASDGLAVDLDRAAWRAARMKPNHDPMVTPYRITVHHTAEPFHGTTTAATVAQMQFLQRLHQVDNGWADIGYHYLIDRAGRLIEGRPIDVQGAHASGTNNIGNIGVCVIGNFASQPERGTDYLSAQHPTPEQMATLERVLDELRGEYGIDRGNVQGHRHFTGTECPGPYLDDWTKRYRLGQLP